VRSVNTNGDDENIDAFSLYISIENTNDWSSERCLSRLHKTLYMTAETPYRNKNRDTSVPLFDIAM